MAVLAGLVLGALAGWVGARIAPRWLEEEGSVVRPRDVVLAAAAAAVAVALLAWRHPPATRQFWHYFALTAMLVPASVVDLKERIIPNDVNLAGLIAGVVLHLAWPIHSHLAAAGGLALAGGLLLVAALAYPGGMGLGDVKLAGVVGLYLGFFPGAPIFLFLSFVIAAAVSITLIAVRVMGRRDYIPFGPFLALGAYLTALFGPELWRWYWPH